MQQGQNQSTSTSDDAKHSNDRHSRLATPAVRGLLKQLDIGIAQVPGTGKDGRVLKEDVHQYVASQNSKTATATRAPTARPPISVDQAQVQKPITLTPVQNQMFKTMTKSLTIPHFLFADEIDVTALSTLRQRLNGPPTEGPKLSFLHFIVKAVSLALEDFPLLNARVEISDNGGPPKLIMREKHNIGIAMDTSQGLLVPNIKNVSSRSILDVASECSRLQALAKISKLSAADLTGGTITVSNIGSIGGTYLSPVLVQSEVAILGIGKARTVPAFDEHGQVVKKDMMNFSWSADHRVIDGATMARMAERVKGFVEDPGSILAKLR